MGGTPLYNGPAPQGPPRPEPKPNGACLLSLDGGGVKGVSALIFLEEIMKRVVELKKTPENPNPSTRPVDYFDLAAGTSTGGLIALMLFRLGMTVEECQAQYHSLAQDVFAPRLLGIPFKRAGIIQKLVRGVLWVKSIWTGSVYTDGPLINAINTVVKDYNLGVQDQSELGEAPLIHPDAGMMIMCSTLIKESESILFRTYDQPKDSHPVTKVAREAWENGCMDRITISTATRATSAAPFFFPPVYWNPTEKRGADLVFWDGGLLNNNPINQLWDARYDLVGIEDPPPKISAVVSIGCSLPSLTVKPPRLFITRVLTAVSYLTNTKAKDHDFERYVHRMQDRHDENKDLKYFRFDAVTNGEDFSIDDPSQMSRLEQVTRKYISDNPYVSPNERVQDWLDKAARKLVGEA